MPAKDLESEEQLKTFGNNLIILDFWAEWCPPCSQMNALFDQLADAHSSITFVKVNVEKFENIVEKFKVELVPSFVFLKVIILKRFSSFLLNLYFFKKIFQNQERFDIVEGADGPELGKKVASYALVQDRPGEDLNSKLQRLLTSSSVMLFMKGTPEAPQCGFSGKIVKILNEAGVKYGSFNILSDNDVRQGLKVSFHLQKSKKFFFSNSSNFIYQTLSNWPTYPQLYSNGKLIGGLDIVAELHKVSIHLILLRNRSSNS